MLLNVVKGKESKSRGGEGRQEKGGKENGGGRRERKGKDRRGGGEEREGNPPKITSQNQIADGQR